MSTLTMVAEESLQPTTVGYVVRTRPEFAAIMGAIGDERILQFKMREQVESLGDAVVNVDGITVTRQCTVDFRWGIDGATWSAWMTFDTPTLAGIAPNINDQFYIEIRATRTGSSTTGTLNWNLCSFSTTINDQGTVGRGLVSMENLHGDTLELFRSIIQSWVWQVGGADHYEVACKPREWDFSTVKPTIYIHSLTQTGYDRESIAYYAKTAQVTIGIKPVKGRTDGYSQQLSRLLAAFDPLERGRAKWTFDYKGVHYIDATLGDVGLFVDAVSGMQEFHDRDSHQVYHEITLSFSLRFYNIAKI